MSASVVDGMRENRLDFHAYLTQLSLAKDGNLRSTEHKNCCSNLNCSLTRETIGDERRDQRSHEGSSWHGSSNTTLCRAHWVIEVILVGIGTQDTAHRRDIKTEERAT